jgi:hypothetical protein
MQRYIYPKKERKAYMKQNCPLWLTSMFYEVVGKPPDRKHIATIKNYIFRLEDYGQRTQKLQNMNETQQQFVKKAIIILNQQKCFAKNKSIMFD